MLAPVDKPQPEEAAFMIQIEVALEKIYGTEVPPPIVAMPPARVVEVETIKPPAALPATT